MSALVGYGSSDEEGDNVQTERPAKIAKRDEAAVADAAGDTQLSQPSSDPAGSASSRTAARSLIMGPQGPAPGPSLPPQATAPASPPDTVPAIDRSLSPYSANRARIQSLTMPRVASFDIPASPSPPPANSEAAAELTARTRKFEHFLALKKQGVHFNDRLASSSALRNPGLLEKLTEFAGVGAEDAYRSTLDEGLPVPVRWPEGYLEGLMRENDRRVKESREGRGPRDFVSASTKDGAGRGKRTGKWDKP